MCLLAVSWYGICSHVIIISSQVQNKHEDLHWQGEGVALFQAPDQGSGYYLLNSGTTWYALRGHHLSPAGCTEAG